MVWHLQTSYLEEPFRCNSTRCIPTGPKCWGRRKCDKSKLMTSTARWESFNRAIKYVCAIPAVGELNGCLGKSQRLLILSFIRCHVHSSNLIWKKHLTDMILTRYFPRFYPYWPIILWYNLPLLMSLTSASNGQYTWPWARRSMQPSSIKYPIMPAMVHSDASLFMKRGLNIYNKEGSVLWLD